MDDTPPVTVVVIPALNEEASLPQVLREIPADRVSQVIVADNGSTDDTANVARQAGAIVVHESERGYGAACLAGLAALPPETTQVVFLDADYSDHPEDMRALLDELEAGHDLVIGSRLLGQAEPGALLPQARFGNRLACFLMHRFFGHRYTDLGPFRAVRREALDRMKMIDRAFGWTVEMQIKALLHGMRVSEVPVRYKKRIGVSKITGTLRGTILAGTTILTVIFKTWWRHKTGGGVENSCTETMKKPSQGE